MRAPPVDRVPHLVVLLLLAAFAWDGSAIPVGDTTETVYRVTAGLVCIPLLARVVTGCQRANLIGGIAAIVWIMAWSLQVAEAAWSMTSLSSLLLWPAVAVSIAYSWGRVGVPRKPKRRPHTHHYGTSDSHRRDR